MSLILSRQFTISTYDPPSTPIALKGQQSAATREGGRVLGGAPRSRRSAPPEEDYLDTLKNTTQTPEVNKKVLPWVSEVVTEGYEPPEGMFGPYDSRPGTRYQPNPPPVQSSSSLPQRNVHPFAYNAQATLPLSALASEIDVDKVIQEQFGHVGGPESDVLSRGARGHLERPRGEGESMHSTIQGGKDSVGMGTFGRGASQEPVSSSEGLPPVPPKSPTKTAKSHRKAPPEHIPVAEEPHQAAQGNGPASQPNVKIHHEHPFSPAEALRKEAEAMALVETLERLMGSGGGPHISSSPGGRKGPRETYETMTSGPSFGHIYHKDGMPVSRHISYQQEPIHQPQLFHIPWGPDIGVGVSRPDILFEAPGVIAGIIASQDLHPIDESPKSRQRKDDRSAYVETVHDDEEPGTVKEYQSVEHSRLDTIIDLDRGRANSSTESDNRQNDLTQDTAAKHELKRETAGPATHRKAYSATSTVKAPTDRRPHPNTDQAAKQHNEMPSAVPRGARNPISNSAPAADTGHPQAVQPGDQMIFHPFYGAIATHSLPKQLPFLQSPAHLHGTVQSSGLPSMTSQMPTQGTMTPAQHINSQGGESQNRLPSMESRIANHGSPRSENRDLEPVISPGSVLSFSTTPSNVKHIVSESKFHDEVLCQLLDAARLNLIGEEAKKALNRAARARVIELRDMRTKGGIPHLDTHGSSKKDREKKERRRSRSKDRKSRRQSVASERPPMPVEEPMPNGNTTQPTTPERRPKNEGEPQPAWAQEILNRLSAFDARFSEMERSSPGKGGHGGHSKDVTQEIPASLLNDLIFNTDLPLDPMGMPIPFTPLNFPFPQMTSSRGEFTPKGGAYLRSLSSDEQRKTNPTIMSWGSNADVELPAADVRVTPPKTPKMVPTINIQAPTESNLGKSMQNYSGSQAGTMKTGQTMEQTRSPPQSTKEGHVSVHPTAVPDPSEKDYPPPPSESIRSHRPSPVTQSSQLPSEHTRPSYHKGDTQISMREVLEAITPTIPPPQPHNDPAPLTNIGFATVPGMMEPVMSSSDVPESGNTAYKTAVQSISPGTPPRPISKDRVTVNESAAIEHAQPNPWDLVTQRLYSWAVVWEESTFSKAMEDISLNRQVGEFALTIFVMMTFKRMLKRNLSETPYRVCDKLFVPPTFAEAINQAVHAQQYKAAQQMLEELWCPFLFKEPPRVIIALTQHLNDPDTWTAHRFDLATGHLRSYRVTHQDQEHDGRPFRWWHAIRLAWPQYKIRDPMEMGQQTTTDWTSPEDRSNNSLRAMNIARNLFLGFRPEHPSDIAKLRESVWSEVKRLREKKRAGRLLVDLDSPSHATRTGLC